MDVLCDFRRFPMLVCALASVSMTSLAFAQSFNNGFESYYNARPPAAAVPATGSAGAAAAVTALEEELRRLTGRLEKVEHELKQLRERQTLLEASTSRVPAPVIAPAESAGQTTFSSNSEAASGRAAPDSAFPTSEQKTNAAPALSVRGEAHVPAEESAPFQTRSINLGTGLKPKELYGQALNAVKHSDYPTAKLLFERFIAENEGHALIGNAYYWLGETYYAQKDYTNAAVQFLGGYQADSSGNKAPDNLLKLAMSLERMGKRQEACTTFAKLEAEFAKRRDNSSAVKGRNKYKELNCEAI